MDENVEAHLIDLELRLQAPSTRKDAAAVSELLSDNFREFGASGRVLGRSEIIAELSSETSYRIVSENFQYERLSEELVLLTYVSNSLNHRAFRSSLWRLEGEHWRIFFHQGTVIPPA